MTTLAEAIEAIDARIDEFDLAVRDAWRIARGGLRRTPRRSSTQFQAVPGPEPLEDDPITAKQRFATVTEELVKASEEIKERKGRGDGG